MIHGVFIRAPACSVCVCVCVFCVPIFTCVFTCVCFLSPTKQNPKHTPSREARHITVGRVHPLTSISHHDTSVSSSAVDASHRHSKTYITRSKRGFSYTGIRFKRKPLLNRSHHCRFLKITSSDKTSRLGQPRVQKGSTAHSSSSPNTPALLCPKNAPTGGERLNR